VHSPEDVAKLLIPKLRDRAKEIFMVLLLDSQNGLRKEVELSEGTLNASLVHPREVYKVAIDHLAASIIVAHNHPSGNREPSKEDIEITRQLVEAGKIVGIPLHDHVIVAGDGYTSFAERGLL
ncbi:MAG: DNA repair protein RadC, partial [Ignavibacteriae bacterium]|nr:DNA repair protein RadC [Ignavibacteriota bacterium]